MRTTLPLVIMAILVMVNLIFTYVLARQLALMARRLPKSSSPTSRGGPRVGENLNWVLEYSSLGAARNGARTPKLIFFVSQNCSACRLLFRDLPPIVSAWPEVDILLCCENDDCDYVALQGPNLGFIRSGKDIRPRLGISFVPAALLVSTDGTAVRTAHVASSEQIEELLENLVGKTLKST